jgi:hypothetical protein
MKGNIVSKISFEELDGLTGEMLPERSVLSTLAAPFHGWGGGEGGSDSSSAAAAFGGHGASDKSGFASNVCSSQQQGADKGLLGLGLASTPATSQITCAPGSVAVL